jgi:hypothetical protein
MDSRAKALELDSGGLLSGVETVQECLKYSPITVLI